MLPATRFSNAEYAALYAHPKAQGLCTEIIVPTVFQAFTLTAKQAAEIATAEE